MRYQDKSFTVAASGGNASYCREHGHTLPDQRGKCLRCSAKVRAADVIEKWEPSDRDHRFPNLEQRDTPSGRQFRTALLAKP